MSLDLPRLPNPIDERLLFQVPFRGRVFSHRGLSAPLERRDVFDAVSAAADEMQPTADRWVAEECKFEEILWMKCMVATHFVPLCAPQRDLHNMCLKDRRLYISQKRLKWIDQQVDRIASDLPHANSSKV
jgi:hypothetical protein